MQHAYASFSDAQNPTRPFHNQHRLARVVKTMAERIELLDEDNRQLRAAVMIYREVIRRTNGHAGSLGQ